MKSELSAQEETCTQPNCPEGVDACALSEMICPNGTTNCCQPNGSGIYTDEGGSAGIGEIGLMITHFINRDPGVSFEARYYNWSTRGWATLTGLVVSADYLEPSNSLMGSRVLSVSETNTRLSWKLADAKNQSRTVDGPNLQFLHLRIQVLAPRKTAPTARPEQTFILSFDVEEIRNGTGNAHDTVQYYAYRTHWRDVANGQSGDYCLDGGHQIDGQVAPRADSVVFQQGIDVSPVSGLVVHSAKTDPAIVTMSCSLGAPARVYGWGYTYNGSPNEAARFDAAIHAKRASYCGDSLFHTKAGVFIDVADDGAVAQPNRYISAPHREAVWTPRGAICLDSPHRDEVEPKFEAPYTCQATSAVQQLHPCPPQVPPDPYVVTGLR